MCNIFHSPKCNNFWLLCYAAPYDNHRYYSLDHGCKLAEKYWPNSRGKHWEHYTPDGRWINNTKRLRSEMFCDQTLHTSRNMNLWQKHRKRNLTKAFDRRFGYRGREFHLLPEELKLYRFRTYFRTSACQFEDLSQTLIREDRAETSPMDSTCWLCALRGAF